MKKLIAMYNNRNTINGEDLQYSFAYNNFQRIKTKISLLESDGIITNVDCDLIDIDNLDDLIKLMRRIKFVQKKDNEKKKTL